MLGRANEAHFVLIVTHIRCRWHQLHLHCRVKLYVWACDGPLRLWWLVTGWFGWVFLVTISGGVRVKTSQASRNHITNMPALLKDTAGRAHWKLPSACEAVLKGWTAALPAGSVIDCTAVAFNYDSNRSMQKAAGAKVTFLYSDYSCLLCGSAVLCLRPPVCSDFWRSGLIRLGYRQETNTCKYSYICQIGHLENFGSEAQAHSLVVGKNKYSQASISGRASASFEWKM